jgi:trans-aconitate methyltransferase
LAHHEELYSGFAQQHFARPAVRAFRGHLVRRLVSSVRLDRNSRVLSLNCGIGDTERLLAAQVASIHGIDISPKSPKGIAEARRNAPKNATFEVAALENFAAPKSHMMR